MWEVNGRMDRAHHRADGARPTVGPASPRSSLANSATTSNTPAPAAGWMRWVILLPGQASSLSPNATAGSTKTPRNIYHGAAFSCAASSSTAGGFRPRLLCSFRRDRPLLAHQTRAGYKVIPPVGCLSRGAERWITIRLRKYHLNFRNSLFNLLKNGRAPPVVAHPAAPAARCLAGGLFLSQGKFRHIRSILRRTKALRQF